MLCTALYPDPLKYSTRHMKMDSASRVTLEANLARNASHRASRVSLDNKLRVVYSYASGTTYHQQSSKCLANFARQIIEREILSCKFWGTHVRDLRFLSSFTCHVRVVYCTTYCTMLWSITVNLWRAWLLLYIAYFTVLHALGHDWLLMQSSIAVVSFIHDFAPYTLHRYLHLLNNSMRHTHQRFTVIDHSVPLCHNAFTLVMITCIIKCYAGYLDKKCILHSKCAHLA